MGCCEEATWEKVDQITQYASFEQVPMKWFSLNLATDRQIGDFSYQVRDLERKCLQGPSFAEILAR